MMLSRWVLLALLSLALSGCAASRPQSGHATRAFEFERDTFAYANELVWEYVIDPASGKTTSVRREPKPDYTLHCFVVARAARQFFDHAHFDPARPKADLVTYRQLVRRVIERSPRRISDDNERVLIPGYANLREFSEAYEPLLKTECGGAWQSYFQRGHWRMIFPFSRRHQQETAERLQSALARSRVPIVHVVCFPALTINHAVLVFNCAGTENGIQFSVYDPNDPNIPGVLKFDRNTRTFLLPRNRYFAGGKVDVYEIYDGVNY